MNHFWRWVKNEIGGERSLYLNGAIAEETWFGDEITPQQFRADLISGVGDITVWINSPGGDVFAAAQIYTMLKEYSGSVTVKIDGMAASAASVIAMAGDEVLMSPVSYMLIHNPATIAIGDGAEMLRTKAMLDEIKEGIINAYEAKTKMSRVQISQLMDVESCFNAKKAVELGFADGVLYGDNQPAADAAPVMFYRMAVTNSMVSRLRHRQDIVSVSELERKLASIK